MKKPIGAPPPEQDLAPTQAVDPRPRMETPTDYDAPARELPGMDAPPVLSDGVAVVIDED